MNENDLTFGKPKLFGQLKARKQIQRIIQTDRLSHAYLITGPVGVGKKAIALALAEAVQGISNLTELENPISKKSSWYHHPDIHLFFPMPREFDHKEFMGRKEILYNDPYETIDFGLRPSLSGSEMGNKQAFYSIEYYREHIRPAAFLKPNEGERTIIILSEVEKMRVEMSNAFLKLLEEPNDRVLFILTTNNVEQLLPTIISRCQLIHCNPLASGEIEEGLLKSGEISQNDATYLSRVAGGNYSITKLYPIEDLKKSRELAVEFLRASFTGDAVKLATFSDMFHRDYNTQGQLAVLSMVEVFLRDVLLFASTSSLDLVTNADQTDVIRKFHQAQPKANIYEMLNQLDEVRGAIKQNVNARISLIVLANRFYLLMRGHEVLHPDSRPWSRLPALQLT